MIGGRQVCSAVIGGSVVLPPPAPCQPHDWLEAGMLCCDWLEAGVLCCDWLEAGVLYCDRLETGVLCCDWLEASVLCCNWRQVCSAAIG